MAYILKTIWRGVRLASPQQRFWGSTPPPLVFSEEVRAAKSEGKPIVALESTIITHGMLYPKNLETALEVENIIRRRGAVPATIAILKGQLTVGLTEHQIQNLAQAKGVVKASRRDLAPIVASGLDGATTVAGTIIAAELADIPIFVTGGIGGVHRNGENTFDISADLNELGRSKTLVVCSGVKSILDIGRTLEYLETQGVCVCAFGNTTDFPAFYTTRSGHSAPYNVETAEQAARILNAARILELTSGIVVAVPVPQEFAMDENVIEAAIDQALSDAKEKGIHGKEVTPFILAAVANVTKGASLQTNIALIKNNAKVGADIAVQFKKLKNLGNSTVCDIGFHGSNVASSRRHFHTSCMTRKIDTEDLPFVKSKAGGDVLVIGGANVDRTYRVSEDNVQVVLILGISGACKSKELTNLTTKDIESQGQVLLVKLTKTKTNIERSFVVQEEFTQIVKKYQKMRPSDVKTDRFFLNYQKRKCSKQVIGKNKISGMPKQIATYLNLPNCELYTGHCLRRTSATLLADSGANMTTLKRHGGWKSSTVAEGYIEDSFKNKTKISTKLTETIKIRPNSPQPTTSNEYPPWNPSSDEIPESPTFTDIQNSQICNNISNSINIPNKNVTFNFTNCPNLTINFK